MPLTPLPMVTEMRDDQSWKADEPKFVTQSGMVTAVIELQPLNAVLSMRVTGQPWKEVGMDMLPPGPV